MSNLCSICPPAQNCIFPADLELYGLQGPNGPWSWLAPNSYRDVWVECPAGWDCPPRSVGRWERVYGRMIPTLSPPTSSPMYLRLRCCLNDIIAQVPPGITKADLNALAMRMLNACAKQQAFCIRQTKLSTALRPAFGEIKPKTLFLGDLNQSVACLGQAFSATVPVKYKPPPGNFPPFTISIVAGSLPPGFHDVQTVQGTAWVVSGIATQIGTYPFTLRAQDSEPGEQSDTKPYQLEVFGITNGIADAHGVITLATADACVDYGLQLAIYGGTHPITFEYIPHPFFAPEWIRMTDAGYLYGVPQRSDSGHTYLFSVKLTDATGIECTQSCRVSVNTFVCPALANPPAGRIEEAYVYHFMVSFGTGPFDYHFGAGTMPPGLTLTDAGFLIGTPTSTGTYVFSIIVNNGVGCGCQFPLTMLIEGAEFTAPITGGSLPNGTECSQYNVTGYQVTAAPSGMTFTAVGLPAGLSMSSSGLITGVPTESGNFTPSITATLPSNPTVTVTESFPLAIAASGTYNVPPLYDIRHSVADFKTWLSQGGTTWQVETGLGASSVSYGNGNLLFVFQPESPFVSIKTARQVVYNQCAIAAAWGIVSSIQVTFSHPGSGDNIGILQVNVSGVPLVNLLNVQTNQFLTLGYQPTVVNPAVNSSTVLVTINPLAVGHMITVHINLTQV